MAFTAHKMYGPKGVGALYKNSKNRRLRISAQISGGKQERGYRGGTLNVPGIVGFGKAAQLAREEPAECKPESDSGFGINWRMPCLPYPESI